MHLLVQNTGHAGREGCGLKMQQQACRLPNRLLPTPTTIPVCAGGSFQINYLHWNPCWKVCFWGKPPKT